MKKLDRRSFLRLGTNTLASGTLLATMGAFQRAMAATDTSGYKALVCVFLFGGNDSFNLIVPRSDTEYGIYKNSRRTLALPRVGLLPISPLNPPDAATYGLHPSCTALQSLFGSGRLALVANVGTLVRPVTRDQFNAGTADLPPYLFSHSDQQTQWMTSYPNSGDRIGWAGRIADLMQSQGHNPQLSINVSVNGSNIWQDGRDTVAYALGSNGAPELNVLSGDDLFSSRRRTAFLSLLSQGAGDTSLIAREYTARQNRAKSLAEFINTALDAGGPLATTFPQSHLGSQLRMVARMIRARSTLGVSRQLFFVGMGGYDTHDTQLDSQAGLLAGLSAGLGAFNSAMDEIGAQNDVTTFTASDFGRTLTSNGDGSDHGWGSHQLVMGGAVAGQRIYGAMPNLTIDGPDDADTGRIIPTQSTDQMAATLARWFGVGETDLDLVFPNLDNFASRNLGFMG